MPPRRDVTNAAYAALDAYGLDRRAELELRARAAARKKRPALLTEALAALRERLAGLKAACRKLSRCGERCGAVYDLAVYATARLKDALALGRRAKGGEQVPSVPVERPGPGTQLELFPWQGGGG